MYKIPIVLALALSFYLTNLYADEKADIEKASIKTIGVLVYGVDNLSLGDSATKLLDMKLRSNLLFFDFKGIVVLDDGVLSKQASYAKYGKAFEKELPDFLENLGYKVICLDTKEYMARCYIDKPVSDIINIAKQNNSNMDALLFIFYIINTHEVGDNAYYEFSFKSRLIMYAIDNAKNVLLDKTVTADYNDLSDEQITKGEFKISFLDRDLVNLFIKRNKLMMKSKFPRIAN